MLFFFEHHGMGEEGLFRVNRLWGESFPAHLHRAYELIAVNGGKLTLQVDQKQFSMGEGDLAFIFCNQIHSFAASAESDLSVVLFSPELIGDFYALYKDRTPVSNVIPAAGLGDLHELRSVYAQKSMLYGLCDRLLSTTELTPAGSRSQAAVLQQIFTYVDRHYGGDCSLKTVARALQYDYAYLSKLFARHAGMRFTEYINNYRIAQASSQLRAGRHTVSEVATGCGYATLRTFHRNFRGVMGCSPRAYLAGQKTDSARGGDAL